MTSVRRSQVRGFLLVCGMALALLSVLSGAPRRAGAASAVTPNSWRYIVLHHSATPDGNRGKFNTMHQGKGWDGLGYHFVITNGKGGPDGALQVGSRWWRQKHGAHAGRGHGFFFPGERNPYNEFGIGICLVGNFQKKPPTARQMKTLAGLIRRLRDQYGIAEEDIIGHQQVRDTACPGRLFPWKKLYGMLGIASHGYRYPRFPTGTVELCSWCVESATQANTGSRERPAGNADASALPPPVQLYGR